MFESFHVPALYLAQEAVLALYSNARTTGCVVNSGHAVTHIVPVYEGYALPHAIKRVDLAGTAVDNALIKLLGDHGHHLTTPSERELARDMKERLAYVARDFDSEAKSASYEHHEAYTLPDGSVIELGAERFQCAEVLFSPDLYGYDVDALHEAAYHSIMKCDVDIRKELYHNTILSGGNTLLDGFADRLHDGLSALAPHSIVVGIVAPEDRVHSAWLGGSILPMLASFQQMWISKQDYDDSGPAIVHRVCF